ncbi:MAG: ABC transporter ATP-binding protein [Planctomycetes bacterium]|nr:ABC transporter ATP-binding protein [Planctomycetota bacterium]
MSDQEKELLLEYDNLHVHFDNGERHVEAVKGLSFKIHAGEVVALVGESGSGKSVSSASAMRLLPSPPAEYPQGEIRWRGTDVLKLSNEQMQSIRGNDIGMIFQEPMTALNPTWKCGAQVAESLELHADLDQKQRDVKVLELFNAVGITEPEQRMDQYPHELSGGMRQRVCIALALACDPDLLIADEPTTALDVTIQAQILDLIRRMQQERGMAVLFITHDLGVVADLADRVVVMWNGEKVEEGTTMDIFKNPQHPYTKGLLECRPRLSHKVNRLKTVSDFLD